MYFSGINQGNFVIQPIGNFSVGLQKWLFDDLLVLSLTLNDILQTSKKKDTFDMKIYITIWSANELTVVSILQPDSGYLAAAPVTMISALSPKQSNSQNYKDILHVEVSTKYTLPTTGDLAQATAN